MKILRVVSMLTAWIVAGCNLDPYPLVHGRDGGGDDDGGDNGDGIGIRPDARIPFDARWDSPPDACVPQEERCNGIDDDCNGLVDDDVPTLDDDPANCGACGNKCDLPNTNG